MKIPKRTIKQLSGALLLAICLTFQAGKGSAQTANAKKQPNFIVIFTDDQGYGDLGTFGSPNIKTPNIDKMAYEGQKWTSFYVAANVCTPSRAGLLTGRLPIRSGMAGETKRVLFPGSKGGLPTTEITIAKLLKTSGYQTACVGKWHLGHLSQYLPTSHGFDYYYGIPYSNDMEKVDSVPYLQAITQPRNEYFQVPLMQNEKVIEKPAIQNTLTERYTREAVKFIKGNKEKPFFLYLAHSMPHVPLFPNPKFKGKSARGIYGDVIEEIDWSVGEVLNTLKQEGLDQNTYVIFITDNGPWALFKELGGSAGPLHGAKGTSYEGGVRVPAIFWGPGAVKPASVSDIGSSLDILPTIAKLAGKPLPADRTYDGYDLSPVLSGKSATSPRNEMFYYHSSELFAARKNDFKLILYKNEPVGYPEKMVKLDKPELYNLEEDASERYNIADKHPEVVKDIEALIAKHLATVKRVPSEMDRY